jgi:hypothetical protein
MLLVEMVLRNPNSAINLVVDGSRQKWAKAWAGSRDIRLEQEILTGASAKCAGDIQKRKH